MLIEGGNTRTHACTLSTVTGIPLIRFHGDSRTYEQCEKAIQMSAGYRDYGHAALEILNTFGWKTIALVFDGKSVFLLISYNIILHILSFLHPSIHPSIYPSFLFVFVLEESFHEAAYFRAISQNSELAVDLVQLIKPNENEDPNAPVLRAMEELKNFAAEAIILFIDKEIVERIVQQVILCVLAKLIQSAFSSKKVIHFVPLILSVIFVFFYTS